MLDETTIPPAEDLFKELMAVKETQDAVIVEQANRIAELEAQAAQADATPADKKALVQPAEPFKVGGKEYRAVHAVFVRNPKTDALEKAMPIDIARTKDLREYLVKNKSTAVEEI